MNIDIQGIVDAKIQGMHESGEIKKRIEDDVQKTVLSAIDSALESYSLRSQIEKAISEDVSNIVEEVGFTGYNGFVAQTIKNITEGAMHDDVAQKIQKVFNDMLVIKHDGIKLSEIFQQYREWVCENTDESDKYERENFVCDLSIDEDGMLTHYTVTFNNKEVGRYENPEIKFSVCTYGEENKSNISSLYLDGTNLNGAFRLSTLSKIQSLLANLYFNKTEIIMDTDDVNDDNSFDIDI